MRTTLTLDDDLAERAKRLAARRGKSFKSVINEMLRFGLDLAENPPARRYRTKARDLGLRPGVSLDNVQELLAQLG